jgi:type I restriction enzyme S subunit
MKVHKSNSWAEISLGDCVSFQTGKLNSNAAKADGAYPFFTCSQETTRTNTFSFDCECVLLAGNNANGIYPLKFFSGKFDAYQRTYVIRSTDTQKLNNRFLYYALRPQLELMRSISTGAATKFLTLTILKDMKLRIPSIDIQKRISSILSAYDDLIQNNARRIKILEEMAQMIYREWFVEFRFPGHESTQMTESETGLLPIDWKIANLSDIARVNETSVSGSTASQELVYIDIASVSSGRIEKKVRMLFRDAPGRARRVVRHGDTIWSTVRPNRRSFALILDPEPNLIVSTGFAVLTPKDVPYTYLYFATTTDDFTAFLTNHATGSAYPAVNQSDFENARILAPTNDVLSKFHSVTAPLVESQQVLHSKNANLRTTRDLLLPKLISGEISVEHFETEAASQVS